MGEPLGRSHTSEQRASQALCFLHRENKRYFRTASPETAGYTGRSEIDSALRPSRRFRKWAPPSGWPMGACDEPFLRPIPGYLNTFLVHADVGYILSSIFQRSSESICDLPDRSGGVIYLLTFVDRHSKYFSTSPGLLHPPRQTAVNWRAKGRSTGHSSIFNFYYLEKRIHEQRRI